jgi:hypothetical protein
MITIYNYITILSLFYPPLPKSLFDNRLYAKVQCICGNTFEAPCPELTSESCCKTCSPLLNYKTYTEEEIETDQVKTKAKKKPEVKFEKPADPYGPGFKFANWIVVSNLQRPREYSFYHSHGTYECACECGHYQHINAQSVKLKIDITCKNCKAIFDLKYPSKLKSPLASKIKHCLGNRGVKLEDQPEIYEPGTPTDPEDICAWHSPDEGSLPLELAKLFPISFKPNIVKYITDSGDVEY